MEDEKRKILTGFLGERWVDPYFSITCHDGSVPSKTVDPNRTFTTGNDMVALKDKIVEMGEWRQFAWDNPEFISDFAMDGKLDPARFCELVSKWWKGREE